MTRRIPLSTLSKNSTARRRLLGGASVIAIAGLLAACGQAPEDDGNDTGDGGEGGSDQVPCMVSDAGGFDDQSFNELSHDGLVAGSEAHGLDPRTVESENDTVYESNIESLVNQGCTLIFSVGFLLQPATETMAANYEDVNFAIIDDDQIVADNVKPLIYDTAQAAFLAGYVAAAYTESDRVATWGGMNIPTVTIFMDGFAEGVEYYNEENGTEVEVLGWDVEAQDGSFTGGFEANPEARSMAEQFISQGADVLMPVGGPIFQPAAEAVLDAQGDNPHLAMIGVDTDLTESAPEYADIFLTSVLKGLAVSVEDTITEAVNGEFNNEPFVGTLENDGVGIADFYDFASDLPDTIDADIEELRNAIIDGSLVVESPSSPSI
ncbi:MAG TPA: BMP family ABC transporter substrate-binding protein [Candidatus Agrococcus pullicola]|uniref:BMP family ABC transporter substrate-binding protein n=1 Tax=Candidatus Agrococcus pullicola TaxID=2838429 RepID=A0A9D1YWB9_9MICO|nr:BMP family ABC transporter substrate-binding protein [Candidatus Agrococcus pullicola]